MARKGRQQVSNILKQQDHLTAHGAMLVVGALRERHDSDDLRMAHRCLIEFVKAIAAEVTAEINAKAGPPIDAEAKSPPVVVPPPAPEAIADPAPEPMPEPPPDPAFEIPF